MTIPDKPNSKNQRYIKKENLGEEPTYQVIDNRVSVGLEKTRNVK